ncbi:MAG: hypothetical protein H7A55_20455 [Verrucomicrobiaceae bacterium]|nr:hypothetical protein [Verrucomicrobiaceae bacterium]
MTSILALFAVLAFATSSWLLGTEIGGQKGDRLWWVVSVIALTVLSFATLAIYVRELQFVAPFSWLVNGSNRRHCFAIVLPFLIGVLSTRATGQNLQSGLRIFNMLALTKAGLIPAIAPVGASAEVTSLHNVFDNDGVCRQQTWFTNGAAAAATALRRVGIRATEAELAVTLGASKYVGTRDDVLANELANRYDSADLTIRHRFLQGTDNLRIWPVSIAVLKLGPFLDRYVVVLEIKDDSVVVADPLVGKQTIPRKEFEVSWRRTAIVFNTLHRK